MKIHLSVALLVAGYNAIITGFSPAPKSIRNGGVAVVKAKSSHTSLSMIDSECDEEECLLPDDAFDFADTFVQQSTTSTKGSAKLLRATVLKNANGDSVRLDSPMKQTTSVVVFLRHLG